MLNNKGQSLVIFVLVLPILVLFVGYSFDVLNTNYEKNKMENLSSMVEDSIDDGITDDEIRRLISKNDKSITILISRKDDTVKVELSKRIKSIFGKIIGKEYYDIKVTAEN